MEFWGRFQSALVDKRIRENIGNHYSVDTNVMLYSVGYNVYDKTIVSATREETRDWLSSAKLSIYWPTLEEVSRIIHNEKEWRSRDLLKKILDHPNVRILYSWTLGKEIKNLDKGLYKILYREHRIEKISFRDLILLLLSKVENAKIVSFDYDLVRVGEVNKIPCHDPWKKLPYEFTGTWKGLFQLLYNNKSLSLA